MSERLKALGHLEEYRLEATKLKLKLEALRDSVRNALDPYEPVEELKAERASQGAFELLAVQQRYKEILEEIRRIEKDLGKSG